MKLTYHASVERRNRIEYIKENIGFGHSLAVTYYRSINRKRETPSKTVLTDTGIILIYAIDTNELITAYIASVKEGTAIYKKYFNVSRCPSWFMNVLHDNEYWEENKPE